MPPSFGKNQLSRSEVTAHPHRFGNEGSASHACADEMWYYVMITTQSYSFVFTAIGDVLPETFAKNTLSKNFFCVVEDQEVLSLHRLNITMCEKNSCELCINQQPSDLYLILIIWHKYVMLDRPPLNSISKQC